MDPCWFASGCKLCVNQVEVTSDAVLGGLDGSVCGTFCMTLGGSGYLLWWVGVGCVLWCNSLAVALESVDLSFGELEGIATRRLSDRFFEKLVLERSFAS